MKLPRWWTPPTFCYEGRRWSDQDCAGGFDRARRLALAVWPFFATAAAMAVLVSALFAFINIADQRDELVRIGIETKEATKVNNALLAEFKPCDEGDPPESPACKRAARTANLITDAVGRISEALAVGIAAHDANSHDAHEALRVRLGVSSALPPRTPITAAPRPATAAPAPSPAPTTPTTSCDLLPNGKCRR